MANIQASRLGCVVLSDGISTTGKYYFFLGQHMVAGKPCYDVAAMARTGDTKGVAIRRHYLDNKPGALIYWEEFREGMLAARGPSAEDEPEERMVIREAKAKSN